MAAKATESIGETLEMVGHGERARVHAALPYSALEPFEADNRSRLYYRVSGFKGEMVSGFEDLPLWSGTLPTKSLYAALVDFYDGEYRGENVRVAVLLQPVAGPGGQGMVAVGLAVPTHAERGASDRCGARHHCPLPCRAPHAGSSFGFVAQRDRTAAG